MTQDLLRYLASLADDGASDSLEEHFAIADEMLRRARKSSDATMPDTTAIVAGNPGALLLQ